MGKEAATYISQLVDTNPLASDSVSVGDDHIKMIKEVLKTQFSGLTGTTAISASEAEMNYLDIATLGTSADSKVLTQASGVVTIAGDVVVSGTTPKVTIGDAGAEDTTLLFDGNAQDYYIALDDSADDLLIGLGNTVGTTPAISIDENLAVKTYGDITMTGTTPTLTIGDAGAEDTTILFDGNAQDYYIALDDSADDLLIGLGNTVGTTPAISIDENLAVKTYGDITMTGTTPTLTIGDAGAEDAKILFDGNAKDFHIGLDDSSDKLVVGVDAALGTNTILTLTDDTVTLGDGAAVDTSIVFDGNAKDFYVGLDDSADKLVVGVDSTVGTNSILTLTDDTVTVGDGAAVDTYLNFDGNTADFRIGIDDGTDKLEIGGGIAHGSNAGIAMDANGDMTLGGGIVCSDEVISRPRFTDYSETVSAAGTKTAAFNIDLEDGNVQTLTMSGGGTFNIGIINALSSHSNSLTILGTNLGSCTATFYAGAHDGSGNKVYWSDGDDTSNNLMTSSGTDVVTFTTFDGGTKFYGFVAGKGMTNS